MSDYSFLHTQGWARQVDFFAQGQHLPLLQQVADLRAAGKTIFPPQQDIFQAFVHTAWDEVRVVILGQDPYHRAGQAHGLAFSVPETTKVPPSLRNILAEVARTQGAPLAAPCARSGPSRTKAMTGAAKASTACIDASSALSPSPCLTRWARQGVLLLNTVLTVEEGKAHSHANIGWQACTMAVLTALAARPKPLALLLWGNAAKTYRPVFNTAAGTEHLVLCTSHPSPLSAYQGFCGCGHFAAVNTWLAAQGDTAITW